MKTLLLIIAFTLSVNCIAQNRYTKMFVEADSAFTHMTDSIKFSQIVKEMNDTTKIVLTVDQCMQLYFTGYLNGSFDYRQKGEFDIDGLWEGMIKQHKALRFNIRFFKERK